MFIMVKLFLFSIFIVLTTFLIYAYNQKTMANESSSASSEAKKPTSEEIMGQFIKTFPELKPADFPPVKSEEDALEWLMTWQSNYDVSNKYIARSDYKDWWALIEKSVNNLNIVKSKKLVFEPTLNKMYAKIEKLEEDEDLTLDIEDIYTAYYENVADEILKQNYDVIGIENGENAEFILAKPNNPELPKLAEMLKKTSNESQISLYQVKFYPNKYQFKFTVDKLK